LGFILGLNEINLIENLCIEFGLKIFEVKTRNSEYKPSKVFDPLKNYKKDSKVFLYDIRKV